MPSRRSTHKSKLQAHAASLPHQATVHQLLCTNYIPDLEGGPQRFFLRRSIQACRASRALAFLPTPPRHVVRLADQIAALVQAMPHNTCHGRSSVIAATTHKDNLYTAGRTRRVIYFDLNIVLDAAELPCNVVMLHHACDDLEVFASALEAVVNRLRKQSGIVNQIRPAAFLLKLIRHHVTELRPRIPAAFFDADLAYTATVDDDVVGRLPTLSFPLTATMVLIMCTIFIICIICRPRLQDNRFSASLNSIIRRWFDCRCRAFFLLRLLWSWCNHPRFHSWWCLRCSCCDYLSRGA